MENKLLRFADEKKTAFDQEVEEFLFRIKHVFNYYQENPERLHANKVKLGKFLDLMSNFEYEISKKYGIDLGSYNEEVKTKTVSWNHRVYHDVSTNPLGIKVNPQFICDFYELGKWFFNINCSFLNKGEK